MSASVSREAASIAITLASRHLDNGTVMSSSTELCHDDACNMAFRGEYRYARDRALRSLSYSVGRYHADYKTVAAL